MSALIHRLAAWARDLRPEHVPARILERARLQHLSVAGAVRAVRGRPLARALAGAAAPKGPCRLATGGTSSRRDALRLHSSLSIWLDFDDYLFLGHTGHGAVCGAWAAARGHTLDEIATASVVANEIAGRVGASLLLGPSNGQQLAVVSSAGAAAAVAWLDGLDAGAIAHALALAMAVPPVAPMHTVLGGGDGKVQVAATVQGLDAVELAKAGLRGSLDILESRDGLVGTMAWVPLRAAFTGLGTAWLTGTLAYKLVPGCAYVHVPVQAVAEILQRHVNAADKRLRPDQVERIDIRTVAPGWVVEQLSGEHPGLDPAVVPFSIRRSVGALLAAYELTPAQLDPAWLESNREAIMAIAEKTDVGHDWPRTMAFVAHLIEVAAPLFAGVTLSDLREVGRRARNHYSLRPPAPGAGEIWALVRARPDQLLDRIREASGDLSDARLDEFQFRFGTEVRLSTVRGGSWPERRDLPEGSPGWPWEETVAGVVTKFAAGAEGGTEAGRALLTSPGDTDAEDWIAGLWEGKAV